MCEFYGGNENDIRARMNLYAHVYVFQRNTHNVLGYSCQVRAIAERVRYLYIVYFWMDFGATVPYFVVSYTYIYPRTTPLCMHVTRQIYGCIRATTAAAFVESYVAKHTC